MCPAGTVFDEAGAWAMGSSPSQAGFAAPVQHLLGDIATHPDGSYAERSEADDRQAVAVAEPCGMAAWGRSSPAATPVSASFYR